MQRFSFFKSAASLVLICSVWFLVAGVQAQTQEAPTANSAMTKGAWAMQFHIDNNFTLSSFQGATLSLKRHYSPSRALRFGLNLGGNFSNSEESNLNAPSSEADGNQQSISLQGQYVHYASPQKRAKLFLGFGPSLGLSRFSQTRTLTVTSSPQLQARNKENSSSWSAGVAGVIGVEWFANSHISFLAEYSSFLGYLSNRSESTAESQDENGNFIVVNKSKRNVNSFALNVRAVNFGLSVYF